MIRKSVKRFSEKIMLERSSVATSRNDTSLDIPVKVALTTAKYDVLALQAR